MELAFQRCFNCLNSYTTQFPSHLEKLLQSQTSGLVGLIVQSGVFDHWLCSEIHHLSFKNARKFDLATKIPSPLPNTIVGAKVI